MPAPATGAGHNVLYRRSSTPIRIGAAFSIALAVVSVPLAAETVLRVSPAAAPGGDGTAERPYAMLPRAVAELARRVADGLAGDVRVVLHDGTHRLTEPLRLGREHVSPEGKLLFAAAARSTRSAASPARR